MANGSGYFALATAGFLLRIILPMALESLDLHCIHYSMLGVGTINLKLRFLISIELLL